MVIMKNEAELEIESLKAEIQRLKNNQRYGLIWEDSPEKLDDPSIVPLLREMKNKRIDMIEDGEQNYLIEGDNYHALKALQHTHKGKVDVIYIDPPYNTGNEFVYNDKIVDKEDGYRHSKWLSFMAKRLKLAQRLLSDEGVIFVSIDDNEQAQLKLLMDGIFGEKNFIANIIVENNPKGRKNSKHISYTHEYLIVYGNNKDKIRFDSVVDKIDERTTFTDKKGDYKQGKRVLVGKSSNKLASKNNTTKNYDVLYRESDNDMKILNKPYAKTEIKEGYVLYRNQLDGQDIEATYTSEFLQEKHKGNNLVFKEDTIYDKDRNLFTRAKSVWNKINLNGEDILTETANRKLKELLMGSDVEFDFPKNINLIKLIIKQIPNKNATVLDFFAGSGTTGHAVLELNKEDGGNRKFILCTNNEVSEEKVRQHFMEQGLLDKNNKTAFNKFKKENEQLVQEFMDSEVYQELGIARSVTYERNRKVIQGYTTPKGVEVEGIAANLRYLETVEYDRMGIMFPFIRDQVFEDVKNLHELAFPLAEYDNYYIQMYDEIELVYKGKPMTVLLNGNEKENELIINHIAHLGHKNIIYRTIESYT